jgi:glycosyltransferase involved in cell wall biosynthesis
MELEAVARLRARGVLIVEQGGRGGVADYTACLAAALAQRGVPVTIATARDHLFGEPAGVSIAPIFTYVRGVSGWTRTARKLGLGKILNGLAFLATVPRLAALARASAVVHVQGWERTSLGLMATFAMRAVGARIVFTAHNSFERHRMALDQARVFPRLAAVTIVHSEADRVAMGRDVVVIPHGDYSAIADGAAPADAAAARARLQLDQESLVVLLFGVLRPDKGLGDLLDAIAHAPGWLALVAGEEDGALAAAAPKLGSPELAGRVTVIEGFLPIQTVADAFAAADVVAVPYRRASQSGVLYLAYGFRRPVIAYPVGGLVEAVLDGESGWICSEPTPAALAEALRSAGVLGRDELRRHGERGRAWAAGRFSWTAIAESTEAVYARAVG